MSFRCGDQVPKLRGKETRLVVRGSLGRALDCGRPTISREETICASPRNWTTLVSFGIPLL